MAYNWFVCRKPFAFVMEQHLVTTGDWWCMIIALLEINNRDERSLNLSYLIDKSICIKNRGKPAGLSGLLKTVFPSTLN